MHIRRDGHLHLHRLSIDLQNVTTSRTILVNEMQVLAGYTEALPVPAIIFVSS